jgi:hypothetical protein
MQAGRHPVSLLSSKHAGRIGSSPIIWVIISEDRYSVKNPQDQ